jgi:hypothetical protein
MRRLLIAICTAAVVACCGGPDGDSYPIRPRHVPYYYNGTSFTEMDQSSRLALRLARERTGIEFVTVLLRRIPDTVYIGDYAAGLFDEWNIGGGTDGKGVLILFVEQDQTLKIEVSYELEPYLTDAYCSSFQPTIKSYYAGRYFGDVFDSIVQNLERRIILEISDEDEALFENPTVDPEILKSSEVFLSGGAGIIDDEYYYEKDAKLQFIKPIGPERIREFESSEDIDAVLSRYFRSLREGINYPFLGILTEGSQMMRLEYPESPHFYRSRWEDCQRGLPYNVMVQGDLAAVRFSHDTSFPIFLRRTPEGLWKVDAARAWVSSWQDFASNSSGPIYRDHPWMFAFPEYDRRKSLCDVPELRPMSTGLQSEIKGFEAAIEAKPGDASNYFKLADIFCWDCMWLAPGIDLLERGLELDPANVPYRWLAMDMRRRFPSPEPNAKHLEILLAMNPDDFEALYRYSWHCWHFRMEHRKGIGLLRKAAKAERRLSGHSGRFRRLLQSYKRNFWRQLAVDRTTLWTGWHYFYVFLLPTL